jgi:hypothetical protein
MNNISEVKSAVEKAVHKVNSMSFLCDNGSMVVSTTMVIECEYRNEFINVLLRNNAVNEYDNNDDVLIDNIETAIMDELITLNPNICFEFDSSSQKGYFSMTFSLKSEKNKMEKIVELNKNISNELYSIEIVQNNIFKKIKSQISKTKTCKVCKSSITVSYLKSCVCPVCKNPMITDTESMKIKKMYEKIEAFQKEIDQLQEKK